MTEGAEASDGVAHGRELLAFADAVIGRDAAAIGTTRADLVSAVGVPGMVDAAGVAGNFERMNRTADAIGIPADAPAAAVTSDIVDQLDLRDFASAGRTPPLTASQRVLGGAVRPVLGFVTRWMARRRDG